MKPTVGMVVAMASEVRLLFGREPWRPVKAHMIRRERLKDDTDLIVARAGVGIENSLAAARRLISEGVTALISAGLAGGLSPGLKAGHLVIAADILQISRINDGKIQGHWQADANCVALARAAFTAEGVAATCGKIITTQPAVLTTAHKESLFRQTRALAVDMESAAVARAAHENNIPFFGLRVICDPAEESVPRVLYECLDPNGSVRLTAVLLNLARRPSLALDLSRLRRHFIAAGSALQGAWRMQVRHHLPRRLASSRLSGARSTQTAEY
ncbi:MAG: hypothetical protein P8X90_30095 [Desulfobacterales bacterium]